MKRKLWKGLVFCGAFILLPTVSLTQQPVYGEAFFDPGTTPAFSFRFEGTNSSTFSKPVSESNSSFVHPTDSVVQTADKTPETSSSSLSLPSVYKVLDKDTGKVLELSPAEYITGVVAAETPASFEPEALKAQAVAAHSYALRQIGLQLKSPDKELKGAYLSTDPAHFQAYLSEKQRKKRFGANFDTQEQKISDAVNAVIGEILVYEEEPIAAAFHSISSGKTESAQTVWGKEVPYLIAVDSSIDRSNDKCKTISSFTEKETRSILESNCKGVDLSGSMDHWIQIGSRSDSGTVLDATAGGVKVTGRDIRTWFDLPSANFSVETSGDGLSFTTYGYGHGVGMSQYGANDMAKEGKTYQQILAHYYPGTQLKILADAS